jgi:hypothetical protein
MARPGWLNDNVNRSYPFVTGSVDRPGLSEPSMHGLIDAAVADCGFIAGPGSEFVSDTNVVRLASLGRVGSVFTFTFVSDAPGLFGVPLVFTRHLSDPDYATEFVESGPVPDPYDGSERSEVSEGSLGPHHAAHSDLDDCAPPAWSGFLTTGNLADLAVWLGSGVTLVGTTSDALVEPALVQNLAGTVVEAVAVANTVRTRATAPIGCPELTFPFNPPPVVVWARCLQGKLRFRAGYNALVSQDDGTHSITLGARVGAGAGEPCGQVPNYPHEVPVPIDIRRSEYINRALDGAPRCGEVLRAVNGVGGPDLPVLAGPGASVVSDPTTHTVTVNVDMTGLPTCFNDMSRVSISL